jgi:flagellar biosynthesis/type III secretory pathway M-ring protein FliF/YscJ
MSYNKFKEELERRINERRRQKTNSWFNLIIRLLALIFVIMIIRYFGSIRVRKYELLQKQFEQEKTLRENPAQSEYDAKEIKR